MRVDRREFILYSAAGALVYAGYRWKADPPSLQMDFEGLYLLEQKSHSMVVHLPKDATGVTHTAQIKALASQIDQSKTAKPDSDHIDPAGKYDQFWRWDLKGLDVKTPESDTGQADLTWEGPSDQDGDEMPRDDAGWRSLARVPDLRVLCGATRVNPASYASFASSVALNHGHVSALRPTGTGELTVWKCTDPNGTLLMRRAFSDKVRYTCPNQRKALTIHVGSQPIVFKPGVTVQLDVTNLPPEQPECTESCDPNMDHFSGLAELVDKKFTPTITLAKYTHEPGLNVYPDYCPGARI